MGKGTLRNSAAREIATTVEGLFGMGAEGGNNALSILPVDSSNSIVVRGDPDMVQRVVQMVLELDRRAGGSGNVRARLHQPLKDEVFDQIGCSELCTARIERLKDLLWVLIG